LPGSMINIDQYASRLITGVLKPEGMTVLVSWLTSLNVLSRAGQNSNLLWSILGRTLQSPQSFPSADIRGIFSMTFRKQLPEERVMVRGFVPDLHVIEQKKISFLCHRVTTELPSNDDGRARTSSFVSTTGIPPRQR
jgi:hypothetical protein